MVLKFSVYNHLDTSLCTCVNTEENDATHACRKTSLLILVKEGQDTKIEMELQVQVSSELNVCASMCEDVQWAGGESTREVERD